MTHTELTAERLAAGIAKATSDPRHAERASAVGSPIGKEHGAAQAADRILEHFATQ